MAEPTEVGSATVNTRVKKRNDNTSVHMRKYDSHRLACDRVQCPPLGPFNSDHLKWYNETAWIPEDRLQDFIEGEENRPNHNTAFKVRNTEDYFSKTTGKKLRTKKRYWCTFGPIDLRGKVEQNLPDARKFPNGKVPMRHTTLTGKSARRGCKCHFNVTRLESRRHAVKIAWVSRNHVDILGKPCHGLLDPSAIFANAHVAPRLSRRTWSFVERLIRTGVNTAKILRAHLRNVRNHFRKYFPNEKDLKTRWSRDMMLNGKSIVTIRQSVLRKQVDYKSPDHIAVHAWVAANADKVFLYQQRQENVPFILGWATEWMIEKAAELGHLRTVAMDATFGTNMWDVSIFLLFSELACNCGYDEDCCRKLLCEFYFFINIQFNVFYLLQLQLFTVMAYDDHQNGVPIAWALLEKAKSEHLIMFLQALKKRVEEQRASLLLHPEWKPKAFIIDVASEEILSIRYFLHL